MYDLVVIGAGSGGLTAARIAAKFGLKVGLIEKNKIGGECLHTGCVPSKALIAFARNIHHAKQLKNIATVSISDIDFVKVQKSIRQKQSHIQEDTDNADSLAKDGIDTYIGTFHFSDEHTLLNDQEQAITFRHCIIASGSMPALANIKGLSDGDFLTSDTIWQLDAIPSRLLVVGAGPIGLELGQAFAMLGSDVTILERSSQLVQRFDSTARLALEAGLRETAVHVLYDSSVVSVEKDVTYKVTISTNGEEQVKDFSHVLVAVGRTPNTGDLNLQAAGVTLAENKAIIVNKHYQTASKHIYAIGDCLAGPLFTHWAAEQGSRAAIHIALGFAPKLSPATLPTATFTTPEIACVGLTEQQLIETNVPYICLELPYDQIDKAVAEGKKGFVRIYIKPNRRVLGVVIVGQNASELIGYFVPLVAKKHKLDRLGRHIQAYPTYTIGLRKLASDTYLDALVISKLVSFVRLLR